MRVPMAIVLLWLAPISAGPYTPVSIARQAPAPIAEELWAAARVGDAAKVRAALDKGAEVNAATRYGATALTFAADKGHLDVIRLLLDRGADVNAQDTFYRMRAIDMAATNNHLAVVRLLIERGSKGDRPSSLRRSSGATLRSPPSLSNHRP